MPACSSGATMRHRCWKASSWDASTPACRWAGHMRAERGVGLVGLVTMPSSGERQSPQVQAPAPHPLTRARTCLACRPNSCTSRNSCSSIILSVSGTACACMGRAGSKERIQCQKGSRISCVGGQRRNSFEWGTGLAAIIQDWLQKASHCGWVQAWQPSSTCRWPAWRDGA